MTDALADRRALKDRVLEAALLHAAFDGWSRRTLANAAQDAGLDAATARRLFPQGGDSLLAWLDDWADRGMLAAVADLDLAKLPVRRRIALLVRRRLELLSAHREAVRRAVAESLAERATSASWSAFMPMRDLPVTRVRDWAEGARRPSSGSGRTRARRRPRWP